MISAEKIFTWLLSTVITIILGCVVLSYLEVKSDQAFYILTGTSAFFSLFEWYQAISLFILRIFLDE